MSEKQTVLGRTMAGQQPPKKPPSRLAAALAGAKVREPWTVPRLNIEVDLLLVPHDRSTVIESDVIAYLGPLGLNIPEHSPKWEAERAARHAAFAVVCRGTDDPVGTVTEWQGVDDDVIGEFWRAYHDVREAYDPADSPLGKEEIAVLLEMLKKKEPRLLRLYGVRRLATLVLTLGDPLASLVRQTFGLGESSPDTSPSPVSLPAVVPLATL